MKALLRGFLTGFGFALGASIAGTLIGYTIGRIGEASVKRLLSPEPTPSPTPSSDESRPMTMTEAARYHPDDHTESDGQGHPPLPDHLLGGQTREEHDRISAELREKYKDTWTPSMRRLAQGHCEGFHEQVGDRECPLCHPAGQHKSNYGVHEFEDSGNGLCTTCDETEENHTPAFLRGFHQRMVEHHNAAYGVEMVLTDAPLPRTESMMNNPEDCPTGIPHEHRYAKKPTEYHNGLAHHNAGYDAKGNVYGHSFVSPPSGSTFGASNGGGCYEPVGSTRCGFPSSAHHSPDYDAMKDPDIDHSTCVFGEPCKVLPNRTHPMSPGEYDEAHEQAHTTMELS